MLWTTAAELGFPCHARTALDFGCGAGRLTRALAKYVPHVIGLDISDGMIELARSHNQDREGIEFRVHRDDDLHAFSSASFDVVCCLLVLQHIRSVRVIEQYVAELVRLLAPGGLLMLQVATSIQGDDRPSTLRDRLQPRTRLARALRSAGVSPPWLYRHLGWRPDMAMTAVPHSRTYELLSSAGGRVIWDRPRPGESVHDHLYLVTR